MAKFDHIFIAPKDWDKSRAFYKDILGWNEVSSWGDGTSERGSVLKSDQGMTVVIAEEHENKGDQAWVSGFNGTRPTVHVNIENVDDFFEKIPKGDHIAIKPEDIHWGGRWTVLKDPDDNLIAFNQPKKES